MEPKKELLTPFDRAIDDTADTALANELRDTQKVSELHALVCRTIQERKTIAKGFEAVIKANALLGNEGGRGTSDDAVAAVERIAHEALAFAREVVNALSQRS